MQCYNAMSRQCGMWLNCVAAGHHWLTVQKRSFVQWYKKTTPEGVVNIIVVWWSG